MNAKEVFALIKGKSVKRYKQNEEVVKIEFSDGTVLTVEPNRLDYDDYGLYVFAEGGKNNGWLE